MKTGSRYKMLLQVYIMYAYKRVNSFIETLIVNSFIIRNSYNKTRIETLL